MGQCCYLAPQTTPLAPSCRHSARVGIFDAFNLRVHHRVARRQEQVQTGIERDEECEGGRGMEHREREREKVNERAKRSEREDGVVSRSEKIGEATAKRRWRKTERSLPSLHCARASVCSLRRTLGIVCFQHAHTCVNQSNHLITNNLLVLLFSSLVSIVLLVWHRPRGKVLFVQRQSAGPDNGPTLS